MVDVLLRLPGDLKWVAENEEDLKFIESVVVRTLCETKLGDLLAEHSGLRAEEISGLDHLVKAGLFKRMKAVE
jgi:hypothetical protein